MKEGDSTKMWRISQLANSVSMWNDAMRICRSDETVGGKQSCRHNQYCQAYPMSSGKSGSIIINGHISLHFTSSWLPVFCLDVVSSLQTLFGFVSSFLLRLLYSNTSRIENTKVGGTSSTNGIHDCEFILTVK